MTTRRKKIALRAYDYLRGTELVVARLIERGESGKIDAHEHDRITVAVEVSADLRLKPAQAEAAMVELADSIIKERGRTLFPAFDERDNLGDETINPRDAEIAA